MNLARIFTLFALLTACSVTSEPAAAAPRKATIPSITFRDATCTEASTQCTVTVTRNLSTGVSSANWRTINGSAIAGSDYVAATGTVTFGAGETSKLIVITLKKNPAVEPTEYFTVQGRAGSNARLADGTSRVNVTDAPQEPAPSPDTPPTPPEPTTKVCADGSVIDVADDCPAVDPPEPSVPAPVGAAGVADQGDSISVFWVGNHTGIYAAQNPGLHYCGLAIGGSVIGVPTDSNAITRADRIQQVVDCNPKILTLLIGANDLVSWNPAWTSQSWLTRLWGYTDDMRSRGYIVAVGTLLPQYSTSDPANAAEFNRRRNQEVNPAIRAAVGTHIDAVIDYAADPVMGPDSAAQNTSLYSDGLHPTDGCGLGCGGQGKLAAIYKLKVDELLGVTLPPSTRDATLGLAPIASNFTVSTALQPTWGNGAIPPSNSPDVVGAFRFICGAGQLLWDDPIVSPGVAASHLHQFYGNTSATRSSTFATLRANGGSTCNHTGTTTAANRSAYWMPAFLDGKGHVVQPDYVQVYYKRPPANSVDCQRNICLRAGIPNGVRFVFGFDMATGTAARYPGHYHCEGPGATVNVTYDIPSQKAYCPAGSRLSATIDTPKCWDGKNLDTTNHRSHLSDMVMNDSTGWVSKCPTTHPYLIPQFTLSAFYSVAAGDDLALWSLSSDAMYPSLPKGATYHADYFEAWDEAVKQAWVDNCLDGFKNASGGDLCNGQQLKGADQPRYQGIPSWTNPNRLVAIPTP